MKEFFMINNQILEKNKPSVQQVEQFNNTVKARGLRGSKLIEYKKNLRFTQKQKEIIIGTLLGDSTIRVSKANYNLKFEQKYTQLSYLIHLHAIFEPFVGTGPRLRIIKNNFHKNYGVSCWFSTYAHIKFKYYENIFYKINADGKRRKIVPKNIHKMLTPRVLAYWFMDDGSLFWSETYILNTQGFTMGDQKRLAQALKICFNLDFNVVNDYGKYYRLKLQRHSIAEFEKLITPYILDSFQYKFGLEHGEKTQK